MIEIRCPNCNKKVAESPNSETVIITICVRCHAHYKFNFGRYTLVPPTEMNKRFKYDKFANRQPYQERMNYHKK